jgi:hypothetical protein
MSDFLEPAVREELERGNSGFESSAQTARLQPNDAFL